MNCRTNVVRHSNHSNWRKKECIFVFGCSFIFHGLALGNHVTTHPAHAIADHALQDFLQWPSRLVFGVVPLESPVLGWENRQIRSVLIILPGRDCGNARCDSRIYDAPRPIRKSYD
ncbi:hypothetical protein K443DRAFT_275152 [Laccaria amethystina LaAM-08-1]|uniref:Uncharacterized protein n=1 Tax=Laccaria amethystina LaAM-08-1 TaxID=1095629 RepID=A0A0C9X5W5_9AGAR|nr:hypothetical protein K443DRAFT_275152 [Laccaria amethystina LaAM-08-1]